MLLSLLLPTQIFQESLLTQEKERKSTSKNAASKGLSKEFTDMLSKHRGLLYQIIRTYGTAPEEWQDLEQEIILQLWQSYPNFDPKFKPSTWVYRIGFNVAVTHFRLDQRRRKKEQDSAGIFVLKCAEEDPATAEQRAAMYTAIRRLSTADRPIVILHLEGLSYQEIADVVGISASNVGTRLNRIRKKLRTSLTTKKPSK